MISDGSRLKLVGGPGARAERAGIPSGAATRGKVLTIERLLALREHARLEGRALVHCHGCFDIVHPGHLRHLLHARAQGDILLVSITGDAAVAKGRGRPLIPEELRAENLAALDSVDWVYIEARPTAAELLEKVRPDVYVKGREYELNQDPRFVAERAAVERHGGRVVFSCGDVVFSSTALISAMERREAPFHDRLRTLLENPALSAAELTRIVGRFRGRRVLVAGEVIQDTYVLCDRPEVADESPIMSLRPLERRTYDGGAAIIARHAAAMGAEPVLVTVLDQSDVSSGLVRRLRAEGVEVRAVTVARPLPDKQRFLVGGQKVMKLDLVERLDPDVATQTEYAGLFADAARDSGGGAEAAVIADFGLGLFTQTLLPRVCEIARARAGVTAGDVSGRRSGLLHMRDLDLICPSEAEARDALRQFDQSLPAVVHALMGHTGAQRTILTMGAEGLIGFDRPAGFEERAGEWEGKLSAEHIPALCAHPIDPLGCGDALVAAATLALASGAGLLAASFLGAVAAAAQVQRLGNAVISASDLRQGVARLQGASLMYAPGLTTETRAASEIVVRPSALSPIGSRAS